MFVLLKTTMFPNEFLIGFCHLKGCDACAPLVIYFHDVQYTEGFCTRNSALVNTQCTCVRRL